MNKYKQHTSVLLPCSKNILLMGLLALALSACDGSSPKPPGPPATPPKPKTVGDASTPGIHAAVFSYSGSLSFSGQNEGRQGKKRRTIHT